jgi:malate dehydrogenase (quinone)
VLIGAGIIERDARHFTEGARTVAQHYNVLDARRLRAGSSQAWNNAGTGHAANCELNYTPERENGSVDISEALEVNTEFDLSRQLWSYLIRKGANRVARLKAP